MVRGLLAVLAVLAVLVFPVGAQAQNPLSAEDQAVVDWCRDSIRTGLEQLTVASFKAGQSKRSNIFTRIRAGGHDREAEKLIARMTQQGADLVATLFLAYSGQLDHRDPAFVRNWVLRSCSDPEQSGGSTTVDVVPDPGSMGSIPQTNSNAGCFQQCTAVAQSCRSGCSTKQSAMIGMGHDPIYQQNEHFACTNGCGVAETQCIGSCR